jgi:ribonuclease BN (tRNA processing enzyme)
MQVTILGSGTSIPHPKRASPGFTIQFDHTTILVDPSSGSLHRAEKFGVSIKEIDYVIFTHFHPDHTGDLAPLLFALKNNEYFDSKKITLIGPTGLQDLHNKLSNLYGRWIQLDKEYLVIHEIGEEQLQFSDWDLTSLYVPHTHNSIGLRFRDSLNNTFAYSGDSDYCQKLIELTLNTDAALIEASQPSELKVTGHLTPKLAGQIALQAKINQLIITHLYPVCDNYNLLAEIRSSGYQGQAVIAHDGMKIILGKD